MTEAMNSSLDPNMIEKMLLGALRAFHMCFITLLGDALGLKKLWLSPWDLNTKLGYKPVASCSYAYISTGMCFSYCLLYSDLPCWFFGLPPRFAYADSDGSGLITQDIFLWFTLAKLPVETFFFCSTINGRHSCNSQEPPKIPKHWYVYRESKGLKVFHWTRFVHQDEFEEAWDFLTEHLVNKAWQLRAIQPKTFHGKHICSCSI